MKEIKYIYIGCLLVCTILFISSLSILYKYKFIIFFFLLLFSLVFYFLFLCVKAYADLLFGIFIKSIISELPQEEIESLIVNNVFLNKYNHTLKSMFEAQDEVLSYAENNFTQESIEKIVEILENYTNIIDNLELYIKEKSKKTMTTKEMFQIKFFHIFFIFSDTIYYKKIIEMSKKENIYTIPHLIFCLFSLVFIFSHKKNFFVILLPLFILLFILHISILENKITFSAIAISAAWFCLLISTMIAPSLLSSYQFDNSMWILLHITMLIVILIGIWITNKMWTYLDIEKRNLGTFFPKYKIMYIIEAKIMKKVRYLWLWFAFFVMIFSIILMYTLIYLNYFSLGSFDDCFLISLQVYFVGNGKNIYFMAETIMAFIINTLYISNIVRLILEPKLK